MRQKNLLILISAAAFASARADAPDGVFTVNFQSPSGNIVCGGDTGPQEGEEPWHGVSCFIHETGNTKPAMPKPKGCGFDWGNVFNIDNKGKAYMSCYSLRQQHQRHRLAVRQPRKRRTLHQLGRTRLPAQPQTAAYVLKQNAVRTAVSQRSDGIPANHTKEKP